MYKHTYEGRKTHSRGESVSFGKLQLTLKAALEIWSERCGGWYVCLTVSVCVCVSASVHMAADQQNVNTSFS